MPRAAPLFFSLKPEIRKAFAMRYLATVLLALSCCLQLSTPVNAQAFDLPLRINMGGPEVTDVNGNLWLGDRSGEHLYEPTRRHAITKELV